jgi:glycosyltransferase involved in cell wall biosynthesis
MKIVTVSDAWEPQVNGVVRTIQATNRELERLGHMVSVIGPREFVTFPCPGYSGIDLSLLPYRRLAKLLADELASPGEIAIHIATEGPLGMAAARFCSRHRLAFTTAYHTRFPQYLRAMFRIPERWTYAFLSHFHRNAQHVMAPTVSVERELRNAGIGNVAHWTRGVDTDVFHPVEALPLAVKRPLFLYVGRVSVEKNIEAFLRLDLPGTRVVAGVGPALDALKRRFPEVAFLGVLERARLAQLYCAADVFVFPSRTDTFGLVMLEALACGTPVAAYPVQGPLDVLGGSDVAVLDEDLQRAALRALRIDRALCRRFALDHNWAAATQQFVDLQVPIAGPIDLRERAHATYAAAASASFAKGRR